MAKRAVVKKASAKKVATGKTSPRTQAASKRPTASTSGSTRRAAPKTSSRKPLHASRDAAKTPVARKVAIRTAVSRPTSPRKAKPGPASEESLKATSNEALSDDAQQTAETLTPSEDLAPEDVGAAERPASEDGDGRTVPTDLETDLAAALAAAILSLELMQGGADPDARTALGDHCTRLWKALREPAILEDGSPFDDRAYLGLLAAANAPPEAADWLATMPGSPTLPDFFARRPGAAD